MPPISQTMLAEFDPTADTFKSSQSFRLTRRLRAASVLTLSLMALSCTNTAHSSQPSVLQKILPAHRAKFTADLDDALQTASSTKRFAIIVQGSDVRQQEALTRLVNTGVRSMSGQDAPTVQAIDKSGTYSAQLSAADIAKLAADPRVQHISPDLPLQACTDYVVQSVGADVATATYKVTGKGVTVAVLDTGLSVRPDLSMPTARIVGWVDLVNNSTYPYDDNGHGTHVGGILAGNGYTSSTNKYNASLKRIAPDVSLVGVKVLDKNGTGRVSTVIAGIDWCIANKTRLKIRIINMSLGHPIGESYKTDPLCQACERAWKAGILVVCAAGNAGRSDPSDALSAPAYGTIVSPANDPYVLTVGAMNTINTATRADDVIASYSSRGPSAVDLVLKPDIVAPGNRVDSLAAPGSTLFTDYPEARVAPSEYKGTGAISYFRMSGTSMAAPVVAGAAALMLQMYPTLTPDTIKARLMVSADKAKAADPFSYGAGYLNIPAAIASLITAPLGALSPLTYAKSNGTIGIDTSGWGDAIVWGNNAIWGNNKRGVSAIYATDTWVSRACVAAGVWSGDAMEQGNISNADLALFTLISIKGD